VVAFAAIALGLLGLVLKGVAAGQFDHLVDTYRELDENRVLLVISFVAHGLGSLLLAGPLLYLYRAAAYRDPDAAPRMAARLAVVGPIVLAVIAVALAYLQLQIVDEVLDSLPLSEDGVDEIEKDEQSTTLSIVVLAIAVSGALALAAAFILISRFARRVGLLSQFMGIIGIIVGVILVLGPLLGQVLGALPIVQWFFLGALGLLFLGRWPGGRGPAWETGEAKPWPSAAELRAQERAEAGEAPEPRGRRRFEPEPEEDEEYEDEPARPAHPRSKKRKRKRRR
jgi:MFS family permease